jgi:hypothetical protein
VRASRKVLVEVNDTNALIVGNPQGILGKQFRPHPINLLYIITVLVGF